MDARLRASSESHASICHRPSPRRRCSEASAGTRRRSARTSSGSCRRARDTSTVDFGDPLTTTGYALCVYDQSGAAQPLLRAAVPGGGTCAGAPCWEALDEGFRYRDPTLALEGIETIDLTGGERTGQSSLLVRARGPVFVPPALPLTPTATVQLTNAESGVCWDADYSRPATNTQRQFSATAD